MYELSKRYNVSLSMMSYGIFQVNDVDMLEIQKTKCTNDILKLSRIMDEFQSSRPQKGGEMTYMDQEPLLYLLSICWSIVLYLDQFCLC